MAGQGPGEGNGLVDRKCYEKTSGRKGGRREILLCTYHLQSAAVSAVRVMVDEMVVGEGVSASMLDFIRENFGRLLLYLLCLLP